MKILIINRRFHGWNWRAEKTNYSGVIDHDVHEVFYIVDKKSIGGLSSREKYYGKVFVLDSLDNEQMVTEKADEIFSLYGVVDRIIALNEEDISVAAKLRQAYGISGNFPDKVARFRDKPLMKQIISDAGLRTPAFMPAAKSKLMVEKYGFPLFLKPADSNSSKGVKRVDSLVQLNEELKTIEVEKYHIECAISGDIFHLDGMAFDNSIEICQVYKYYNSCYLFTKGIPVGVMMNDNPEHRQKLLVFAQEVIHALDLGNGPFHLELFLEDGMTPAFLEIGGRVGGAFVSHCIEHVHGVSLFEETIKLELDPSYRMQGKKIDQENQNAYCGWLLFPEPKKVPAKVTADGLVSSYEGISYAILPQQGDVLDGRGGYIKTSGTFLLKGDTMSMLKDTMLRLMGEYKISTEPIQHK